MLKITYQDLLKLKPVDARRKVLEVYFRNGGNISRTSREIGVSRKTVRKVVRRYKEKGEEGLRDLSRAPRRRPRKTSDDIERKVIGLKKRTGWGFRRIAREMDMSPWTVRNILRRHGLTKPYKVRAYYRGRRVTVYYAERCEPLQFFQVDLKEIRDKKTLPRDVYEHIGRKDLPLYQWTAIDVRTRVRFIGYSYEKSFRLGEQFMRMVVLWVRGFGIRGPIYMQTDNGQEFGGFHRRKFIRLHEYYWERYGVKLYRIRRGRKEDNGFVERSHRTDDEEFYVPRLKEAGGLSEFMEMAAKWLRYYNVRRRHFGVGMDGMTPLEKLKSLIPWMSEAVALFPVVLLEKVYDSIPSYPTAKSGNHVQAHYSRVAVPSHGYSLSEGTTREKDGRNVLLRCV